MGKSTWSKVKKGDVVELAERNWTVVKIKAKGKKADIVVEYKGRSAKSRVKLADKVRVTKRGDGAKSGPLYDPSGAARRWATRAEAKEALESSPLPVGNPAQTKPPAKPGDGLWDTPATKTEKLLDKLLEAHLVGEAKDEAVGYYVPPVDVSSVAAHLALFHGGIPEACDDDEARMIAAHSAQHDAAKTGAGVLAVNHWHTPTRPDA
jgi:hypothetical protein